MPGTVHGLLGENGSGKSTMLGILSGQRRPDEGRLELEGRRLNFHSPSDALHNGIAMVAQEVAVAPDLTVTENILMGRRLARSGVFIDWASSRKKAARVLDQLNLDYDPDWLVRDLRPDQRQMVEIARAISTNARLIILDEPTSSLDADEVDALFAVIKSLKAQDVTVLFVSHRFNEIFAICDSLTILRDGKTVVEGTIDKFDADSIVRAMVGGATEQRIAREPKPTTDSPPALELCHLNSGNTLTDISLDVRPGEVVGLFGLVGSGRSELLECIFGIRDVTAGEMSVRGTPLRTNGPQDAIRCGIAFVPPDRKEQGLVLSGSVRTNIMSVSTASRNRLHHPRRAEEDLVLQNLCTSMRVRLHDFDAPVEDLSGGNQQKVVLAKWLARKPEVLLLDEPTRGVDVRAKVEIHRLVRNIATEGVAVLVSSSEAPELLDLCDRIIVMSRGRTVTVVEATDATEERLMRLASVLDLESPSANEDGRSQSA
ncbi:MAG: sugar ABC transporter ATP-binding protein [Devosia sp.]|nr:sugar ABC transporter ATP-binding protein [Devosia sp.]